MMDSDKVCAIFGDGLNGGQGMLKHISLEGDFDTILRLASEMVGREVNFLEIARLRLWKRGPNASN